MKIVWCLLAASCCGQDLWAQAQSQPSPAVYVQRGEEQLRQGNWTQALAEFDRALEQDALNLAALTGRARANFSSGQPTRAITDWSGAIALRPAEAALYVARATAHLGAGDTQRAAADQAEAGRLTPNTATALAARASQLRAWGLIDEARKDLERALALNPASEELQRELERLSSIEAPAVSATKPISAPPSKPAPAAKPPATPAAPAASVETLYQQARDLLERDRNAEGIAMLSQAIELQPNRAVLWNTRGYGYYRQKDYARAIADFDEALRRNPEYLNAIHNRALAKRASGDTAGYEADRKIELELERKQAGKR